MKKTFSFVYALMPLFLFAQHSLRGYVTDAGAGKPLSYATISLVKASDSTLVTFARADSAGKFILKSLAKGNYKLSASYVGYNPAWMDVNIEENDAVKDIGNIQVHDLKSLSNVTVISRRPPVIVNNDTLEFNAENFKTQPNAVVEELLKKMPGITIDPDGTVRLNGQPIRRVLVNGKEFFTGDPKMATKNLPADAIDKVQVFDKRSDQAEFTGIDDGNSEKAINLKMKPDRNNALFGKATAGTGTSERYDGQFNINKFKGEKQLSLIGMDNNTNRQGFSFVDALSFSGDMMRNMKGGGGRMVIRIDGSGDDNGLPIAGLGNNQPGIATTYAAGVNFNNKWGKKTDVNASYIFNDQSLVTLRDINRQYLNTGNNFNYTQSGKTTRDNLQHRANISIDHKIDSFNSIKFTSAGTFQNSKTQSTNNYASLSTQVKKLNDGYSISGNDADGFTVKNSLLYRKRFRKKGRTISAGLSFNYSESVGDGQLVSNNVFYDTATGNGYNNPIDQHNHQSAFNRSYGWSLTYTEPTWRGGLAEVTAFQNINTGSSGKTTMDYNVFSGKHDLLNDSLSNSFESNYTYTGAGLNFRTQKKKWVYSFGATVQKATMKSFVDKNNEIHQAFTDVLPSANLNYKINSFSDLRLEYNTNTQQPSVTQLQPVADVSDPLNIREGNPALKREYSHNINLNFMKGDPATRRNIFVFISMNQVRNAIVSSDQIDQATGVRTTKPVNADGTYSIFSSAEMGFPVKKLKSRIEVGSSVNYFNNIAILNGNKNIIRNLSLAPNVSWSYSIDNKIDVEATVRVGYNKVRYSLQEQFNTMYWQQQYSLDMTNYLPWGLVLNNNFSYTRTTGRTAGYNTSVPLWNASVAKGFMKNKRAELKLSAFDLLKQNVGINRSTNTNYIEDVKYNVLQRYFLLSFTYSLNKSGLNGGPRVMMKTVGQ